MQSPARSPLAYAPPAPRPGLGVGARITLAVAGLLLLAPAAFCACGFLASFEYSGSAALPWKLGYAATGATMLLGSLLLLARAVIPSRRGVAGRG